MSTTQTSNAHAAQAPSVGAVDTKLEVVVLPVADVDRAKRFYEGLGWRLDADFANGDDWRVVQMTPPGSPSSVMFGKGFTPAVPGSTQGTFLVVDDVAAARAQFIGKGIDVSEVFHFDNNQIVAGTKGRLPGPDPDGRSYFSFASFSDPDGNGWLLQEVTTRFPGRGFSPDVATVTSGSAGNRGGPWQVRTDGSEAPLVGVVRRLPRGARAGQDARRGGRTGGPSHRTYPRARADIASGEPAQRRRERTLPFPARLRRRFHLGCSDLKPTRISTDRDQ